MSDRGVALALLTPISIEIMQKLAQYLDKDVLERLHREAHQAHCDCCIDSDYNKKCSGIIYNADF
jgi:hypothetical protein